MSKSQSLRDLFGGSSEAGDGDPDGDRSDQEAGDDVDPERVDELEAELSSMADRVESQADRIDELEEKISATQSRLDKVSKALAGSIQSGSEKARRTESDDVRSFKKMLSGR